jgi:hypothetical protein
LLPSENIRPRSVHRQAALLDISQKLENRERLRTPTSSRRGSGPATAARLAGTRMERTRLDLAVLLFPILIGTAQSSTICKHQSRTLLRRSGGVGEEE